jgi:hypothetical protein
LQGFGDENRARSTVPDDRLEADRSAARPRRVARDCHHSGIEAAQKSGDELQTGGVEEQSSLAHETQLRKPGCDSSRPAIELPIGEPHLLLLTIGKEHVSQPIVILPSA